MSSRGSQHDRIEHVGQYSVQVQTEETERFDRARHETIRYHEELYLATDLGEAGSWLSRPHRLMEEALHALPSDHVLTVYDLGCGIGRHALPMLEQLPAGSRVYAVDLLESALLKMASAVPADVSSSLHLCQADLATFEFEAPADLVLAFSAVEHLPDDPAIRDLFRRVREALLPGGVFAVGIVADRFEVDESGLSRPALLESEISVERARALLAGVFGGFQILEESVRPTRIREERGGAEYLLCSTLLTTVLRRAS